MTREEAVNKLNDKIKSAEYVDSDYIDCVSVDAVKMAISALSVPETNVGDTIRRQAAIDAIDYATFNFTISGKRGFQNYKEEFEKASFAIRDKYIEALKALPSAQPEIVRCKDCKHFNGIDYCFKGERGYNSIDGKCFCECGRRKDETD